MPLYRLLITAFITLIFTPNLIQSRAVEFRLPDATLSEETPGEKFNRSDANGDGKLSFNEYLHMELPYVLMKGTEFSEFDLDGDGFVSKREYKSKLHSHTEKYDVSRAHYFGQIYGDYDENFDMMLSEDEIKRMISNRFQLKPAANFKEIFRSFDTNHDGGLDIDEYIKFDDNMPLDEFLPDETNTATGGPPKSRVHCDADEMKDTTHHHTVATNTTAKAAINTTAATTTTTKTTTTARSHSKQTSHQRQNNKTSRHQ